MPPCELSSITGPCGLVVKMLVANYGCTPEVVRSYPTDGKILFKYFNLGFEGFNFETVWFLQKNQLKTFQIETKIKVSYMPRLRAQ